MSQGELFGAAEVERDGLHILRGYALPAAGPLLAAAAEVTAQAPFRHMITPGGHAMSAAMSNCGIGWVTDRKGYRYSETDPLSGQPWPVIPDIIRDLAVAAARSVGFAYVPDGCLVNRYAPGAKMGLHQDLDEGDRSAPIVSVSLGLPAVFQFGGLNRGDPVARITLEHGDVVVWGGPARLAYHGVLTLKDGLHPDTGRCRINLTVRKTR